MARSHTGALAGSRAAYDAVIEECGAIGVDTVDELMNVAQLCANGRRPDAGGVGLVTDSGGLRELAMDCAAELDAPLARLSPDTIAALRNTLPASLEPSNPLDCAAELTDEFAKVFERGIAVLAAAPEVSMIGLEADLRDDYVYLDALKELALALPRITEKPCFFYSSFARANNRALGEALAERAIPCFNGVREMLLAVKKVQEWADRLSASQAMRRTPASAQDDPRIAQWRGRLRSQTRPDEREALALLDRFGVPTIPSAIADNASALLATAERLGYPLALKTAADGIDHKTDQDGVRLDLADRAALLAAYADLAARLGPRVVVQRMAPEGVELAMGCIRDADFGPLVMVSAGGTLIDLLADRRFALAPFDTSQALRMIEALPVARILNGIRGAPVKDKHAAAQTLAKFSELCAALGDSFAEIDVNPLIVGERGAIAVDALLVLR
jgi:acetyltransferase